MNFKLTVTVHVVVVLQSLGAVLKRKNVIINAETGSGKTLCESCY